MPLFGRKAGASNSIDELGQEREELLRSIQNRGQADMPGASRLVSDYLREVVSDAGAEHREPALDWARDRMRFFIAIGWSAWFQVLEQLPSSVDQPLKAEYRQLLDSPDRFGPEALVAWWWLLQPSLFKPLVSNQLREMKGALADGVQAIDAAGGDYAGEKVDWADFRRQFS